MTKEQAGRRFTLKEAVAVLNALDDGDASELSSLFDSDVDEMQSAVVTTEVDMNKNCDAAKQLKQPENPSPPNRQKRQKVSIRKSKTPDIEGLEADVAEVGTYKNCDTAKQLKQPEKPTLTNRKKRQKVSMLIQDIRC